MAKKGARTEWEFEAEYITVCNCDWGCPCNFNARPTQGNCEGLGVWRITKGHFGKTKLDGVKFGWLFWWPGLIEKGNGVSRLYVDSAAKKEQVAALEEIATGNHGGGIFAIFPMVVSKKYPTKISKIEFNFDGLRSSYKIADVSEAEMEPIKYPDGTVIEPLLELPHGIEFKRAVNASAKRWWMKDEEMLAYHTDKYAVACTVKFNNSGCAA